MFLLENSGPIRRHWRRGFTLIELLVAVAIIAILMSLLLPSLGKARQQAKSLACVVNLRTIGTGFMNHLADSNSAFPVQPTTGGRGCSWDSAHPERNLTTTTWWGALAPNLGWTKVNWLDPTSPDWADHSAAGTVGQCPEFKNAIPGSFTYWANCYVVVDPDISYVPGTWVSPRGWGQATGIKEMMIGRPSAKVLTYEVHTNSSWPITANGVDRGREPFHDEPNRANSGGGRAVHGANNNFLFCDGHAGSILDCGSPSKPVAEWPMPAGNPGPDQAFRIEE